MKNSSLAIQGALTKPKRYLLWIDGVIDDHRRRMLTLEPGFSNATQYDDYVIAEFSELPRRFGPADRFRYLDPHRFVLQTNPEATNLEINFNPTPEQLEKLRAFKTRLKEISNDVR